MKPRLLLFGLLFVCATKLFAQTVTTCDTVWTSKYYCTVWPNNSSIEIFHPSSTTFISFADTITQVRNTLDNNLIKQFTHHDSLNWACFSPSGKYLALFNNQNGKLCLYDGITYDSIKSFSTVHDSIFYLENIAFAPNDSLLAISSFGKIQIINLATDSISTYYHPVDTSSLPYDRNGRINGLKFSSNSNELAFFVKWIDYSPMYQEHSTLNFLDVQNLTLKNGSNIPSGDQRYSCCEYSNDGKYIVTIKDCYNITKNWYNVLDATTKQTINSLIPKACAFDCVDRVKFSKNNQYLYVYGDFGTKIYLFNFKSTTQIATYNIDDWGNAYMLADISNDNKYVLAGNSHNDGCLALYDLSRATSVEEIKSTSNMKAIPNPTSNRVTLSFDLNDNQNFVKIQIFNEAGILVQTCFEGIVNSNQFTQDFDVSDMANGIYMVKVFGNNLNLSSKFIISK